MFRSTRRLAIAGAALLIVLGLAVPASANPITTVPPTTLRSVPPRPVPLAEPRCRPGLLRLRIIHPRAIRRCGPTPAVQDAGLRIVPGNGLRAQLIQHPRLPFFAIVVTDVHLGYLRFGDPSPEFASAATAVIAGPGVVGSQTRNERLGAFFTSPALGPVRVNDFFPAAVLTPRDNTPKGPGNTGCTSNLAGAFDGRYKLPPGVSGSVYNDATPVPVGCISAAQLLRSPFIGAGLSRADWVNIGLGFSSSGGVRNTSVVRIQWAVGPPTFHVVQSNPAGF